MIAISYSDAVKLFKKNKIEDVLMLESYYEKQNQDDEIKRLQKKIDSLQKKVIQLENQKCIDNGNGRKTTYKFRDVYKLLKKDCGLTDKEIKKVYSQYGQFAGARNYGYRMLGLPIPIPEDKCDDERKAILKKYRELRDTVGIKEANIYFINADNKLKCIEEV